MANEIDLSQFVPDEPAAGQAAPTTDWSQFTPDPPKEPPGLIRKLADLGLDFTQGGAGVLGAAASGLFGAPDPEGFISGRKNILEANPIGYGMQEVSKYAMELQSDERKAERASQAARMQAAEDTGSTWAEIQAGAQNFADSPASFMASAVGSMVPTVAAGMLTGGVAVPAALGGVIGAGSVKEQIAERIRREGAKAGLTPEQAAIQADAAQAYSGENWDQLALGAGLGVVAGGTGIEKFVGGGAPIKNVIGRALMGSITEAIPEAAQGGQERLAANVAAQREGYGGETWTGVAGQATTEALASAGPGGVMAALNPAAGPISRAAIQAQQQQAAGALPAPGQLSGDAAIQAGNGMPQADPSQDYELERQKTEREGARRQEESRRAVEDLSYLDQLNGWAPGSALNGAVERLAELEQAAQGTPDQQVVGEDGQATVVPGTAPRDLTPEEVAEYGALSVAVENTRRIQETRAGSEPTQDMAAPAGQQDPALPFTQPPYDGPSPTVGDPEARSVDPRVATAGEPIADPAVQLDVDRPTMRQQYLDAQRKRARGELLSQQEAGVLNGPDPFEGQSLSLASPTDEISTNARQEAIEDVAFANDDNPADVSVYSAQDLPDVATRNERGAGLTREAATVIEGLGRIFGTEYRFYESPSASQRGDGFVLRGRRPDVAYIRATEGDAAPLVVAGHETYHILSQAEKARFSKAIEPYVDTSDLVQLAFLSDYTGGKYKANIEALIRTGMDPAKALDTILVQAEADGIQGLTRAKIREEFDADIFGNRMKDTEFWNKVFNELKAQDRTLLVKIRDSIKQAITYLRKQAGKVRGFDTDQYIRDLDAVQQIAARALLSRAGGKTRSEPGSLDPDSVVRSTPRERVGPYSTETLATMNQNWYAKKGVQYNIEQTPEGFFLAPAGEANEAGRMDQGRDAGTAPDARADGLEAGRADRQDRTPGRDQQAADEGRVAPADTSGVRSSEAGTVSLSAVHFSREPRQVLDGRFYGTGLKGAEARRLAGEPDKRLLDRVYAYVNEGKGIKPESGVGSYPHQLDLSNLYDFAADPLGLRIEHRGNLNGLESAILDQGFNGYYVKGAFGNQGAAVVMGNASHSITPKVEVVRSAPRTIAKENQMSVTVGGKPGEFGWSPAAKMAAESALQDYIALDMFPKTPKAGKKRKTETDPADALVVDPKKLTGTTVPPFIGPTQYKPDLVVVGEAVRKVLATKQARSVLEDLTGAKITGVTQIAGSWGGKPEPSFILTGDMTFEQANDVSKVLGIFVAQDAVVAAQPWLEETEDQTSAVLISQNKVMTPEQVQVLSRVATEVGLDYSTTADGKGAKFLNFDGDAALEALVNKARSIAEAAGLTNTTVFYVRSALNEAETYFKRSDGSDLRQTWRGDSGTGPSDLFRRAVDHILVPYAKAVGAQGYRFSPDRFGDKFGLTEPEVEYIRSTLRPKSGKALSTVPVLTGAEVLSPPRSNTTRKIPKTTKNDLLWALQNRAAEIGFIEPGDYSPEARKIIAEGMAEEVIHALSTPEGQSAVGWYDRALHKAKTIYEKVFPELREHADSEMMFDAFLGIASQGNDVGSNATFAGRMYYLTTRKGMTISEAVEVLYGTFGKETRAVENNFLKLEDLINRNGMDTMRAFFNKKGTVASIKAELRRRKELYDRDGTPLEVEGQADQIVNGWMVFGPKIGSFINNLHGDYSTLTADLWFSRTWNRMLGYVFRPNSELESQQYIKLYRAMLAEARSGTGLDVVGKSQYEIEQIANDPESMIEFAEQVHTRREKEYASLKEEAVTPVRQAAKALMITRLESVAAPRTDLERAFQQNTVEQVQRIVKRKTGTELTIADIQAVVWYHEKDLFKKYGVGDSKAEKADYADAAAKFVTRYNEGDLFYVEKPKPRYVWGEKGSYLADDVARSARRSDLGFYSQLQRAVEDTKFQVQPAGQWKSWLAANAGKVGVKADEIQWSGITDWLDLQGANKVTKEAVSAYLAEGGVRVEEVTKGDIPAARLSAMMEAEGLDLDARARMSDREKSEWLKARNLAPSYGKWRTPGGGTNYREVLLTLPVKTQPGAPQPVRPRVVDAGPDANGRGVFNVVRGDAVLDTFTTWSEATDFAYGVFENESIQFNLDREAKAPKTYKSGHWEEKNILAHIRLDDRAGPEGEHILFVQELQSDWAQDGRKIGFDVPPKTGKVVQEEHETPADGWEAEPSWRIEWDDGTFSGGYGSRMHAEAAMRNAPKRHTSIPAAPFVTDTKAWTALGLKRIITMAAEQGYDQVALVSGAQAAEMFQLDKQVEQISYNKGSKFLRVLDKAGDTIINGSKNPEELPDLLGKEIAERIMATEGNFVQLEGEGLKIEATGMRGFYDKIVPQVANDVLKKLGGGKVTQIQTESWNDAKWGDMADGTREFQTQLGFDITPAMREKVKIDGLPLFSARRAEKAFGTITAAQEAALRATGLLREPKTIRERFDELTDNAMKRLVQGTVDQYAPLRELDFRAYVLSRMSKGSDGTFEAMLRFGKPVVNGDTIQVDTDAGGLMDVLSSLSGEQDRFLAWIAANRAEQLTNEGKEFLFTPAQITDLKQLNAGAMADGRSRPIEYGRVLKEFNAFQDSVLAIAEARGLIDAESRQVWKDAFYVPFYRNMEDGTTGPSVKSGLVNQYAFKKLKGSQRQLNEDLLANTLQNMAHLLSASAKNHAASASLRAAESAGVAHRVPSGTKGAVRFLDAGREQHYLVDDPFILDAITSLESVKVVGLEKVLSKFKHYLTLGVTVNPTFQIRSLMRDMLSALAITNIKLNPVANVIQGIGSQLRQDQDYINALASGGLIRFNSLVEGNRADYTRKLIRQGVRDSSILDTQEKITGFFSSALDKWMAVGDIGESTNRMALYKQQIAAGADPLLAAYQARDMMDFSMQGQWRAIRFLTQVVPFLNARMQGLYKLGRDGVVPTGRVLFGGGSATDKQIAKRFGAVTGAVAMASILLMMSFKDDEDWQKREDWDRDTYWWFKHDGIAYRIPKPFEVGAIGTIAERTAELFMDDEMNGARFGQRLGHMMSSTFALNPIPQMIKPLLDVYSNEESFTRRPIETMGMERLQAKDRYTGSTSELAKWLGQVGLPEPGRLMAGQYSALSPVQIDALIRGYFSWLGVSATKIMDEGVRLVADRPERPSMQLRDAFMVGNFAETLPANASRYVTTLYHQSLAIEEAYASYRSALRTGNPARASELLANEGDQIRMQPMVSKAKRALAQLNENIRQIERSRTMSAGEKRAQIDRIKAIQNGIAMRATRAMEG